MRISNRTKSETIAENAGVAATFRARLRGLLGRPCLPRGEALVLVPCSSIHTFGMRFPIDAVFFDRRKKVVAVIKDLKPSRVSGWHPRAHGVVELPGGLLSEIRTEPGDELEFS